MKNLILTLSLFLLIPLSWASGQQSASQKPPVGIPADAKLFNGKWYRVYLEKGGWKRARDKCTQLGGQLAVIPDEPTQAFIKQIADGLQLWLGATYEKVNHRYVWVDGTRVKFTAWAPGQPSYSDREHYLQTFDKEGRSNDAVENDRPVAGYICEWRTK